MGKMTDNKGMAKQKTMAFQVDPRIRAVLEEQSKKQDRSLSWLINDYIWQAMVANKLLPPKDKVPKITPPVGRPKKAT